MFSLIQIAQAAADTPGVSEAQRLVGKINDAILFPLIALMMAIAFVVFLYGAFEYVKNATNEAARETGRSHLIYGVIGMLVMLSAGAILQMAAGTFGLQNELENAKREAVTVGGLSSGRDTINRQPGEGGGGAVVPPRPPRRPEDLGSSVVGDLPAPPNDVTGGGGSVDEYGDAGRSSYITKRLKEGFNNGGEAVLFLKGVGLDGIVEYSLTDTGVMVLKGDLTGLSAIDSNFQNVSGTIDQVYYDPEMGRIYSVSGKKLSGLESINPSLSNIEGTVDTIILNPYDGSVVELKGENLSNLSGISDLLSDTTGNVTRITLEIGDTPEEDTWAITKEQSKAVPVAVTDTHLRPVREALIDYGSNQDEIDSIILALQLATTKSKLAEYLNSYVSLDIIPQSVATEVLDSF